MNNSKITLKELIAKKDAVIENKNKLQQMDLYVKSLDGTITIQEASRDIILDCAKREEDADAYVVYNCVVEPNLKDKELQRAFEVVEPMEIVNAIFKQGDITNIAMKCLELAGYGENTVTEIKN